MAAEGITITVTDEAVLATLGRLMAAADDLSPVMSEIAGSLVTATKRHIERERGPEGPWKPLSPRTANRRGAAGRRRGYDNMLRVSNHLYSSITGASGPTEAQVGTNVPYAAAQQLGADIDMPERSQTVYQRYDAKTGDISGFTRRSRANLARDFTVGAHTVHIPARPFLYLDAEDVAEIERIATDSLKRQAELP